MIKNFNNIGNKEERNYKRQIKKTQKTKEKEINQLKIINQHKLNKNRYIIIISKLEK